MEKILDVNIESFTPMVSPESLVRELPLTAGAGRTVIESRDIIRDILAKKDKRLLVVTGPCSIHDEAAALDYAERLNRLTAGEQKRRKFSVLKGRSRGKSRSSVSETTRRSGALSSAANCSRSKP